MANAIYPKAKQAFLDKGIDLNTDTIKVVLLKTDYAYDAAHDNLDDISGAHRLGTSGALQNPTITDGVFDADDIEVASITGEVAKLAVFLDTGTESTSKLIAFFDTVTGFPITLAGGTVLVRWSSGGSKIFAL